MTESCGERHLLSAVKRECEASEDRQVRVKPDAIEAANAERREVAAQVVLARSVFD